MFTKLCLVVDLLFTYAVVMYPFTEALEQRLFDPRTLNVGNWPCPKLSIIDS